MAPRAPLHGHRFRIAISLATLGAAACADIGTGSNADAPSYEEFVDQTYLEPFAGGVYIVNGDTPVENEKKLREYYHRLFGPDALIVHRAGGVDAVWSSAQKRDLRYCVSDSFGARKAQVVAAMEAAAGQWEAAADVGFVYVPAEDNRCDAQNGDVIFDVRPTSGAPYLARAFFPDQSRATRSVIIDSSAHDTVWSLVDILAHELGHALGFRHEHTRPEAGTCFEDNRWRPLTPYDSASIMHYPQCNGSDNDLSMTDTDRQGAAALYGPAGGNPDPDPDPEPDPDPTGVARAGSDGPRSVARDSEVAYQPLSVIAGTPFEVSITGSGDADLYVRFGARPDIGRWDCRPYFDGSSETCRLDVPSGETEAYIMVRGFTAATYSLEAAWIAPQ